MSQFVPFIIVSLALVNFGTCQENKPITIGAVKGKNITISPVDYGHGHNWADALTYCQRFNSQLVSIQNAEENNLIKTFLKEEATKDRMYFAWTSGTDYFTEGNWYWLKTKNPIQFNDWTTNQPNQNDWYNCLVAGPGGWQSMYCEVDHARAICESS